MPYHGYREVRFPLSGLLPEVVTTEGSTSEVFNPKRVEYRGYAVNSIYLQPRDVRGKFWAVYCDVDAMWPIHMAKPSEKKKEGLPVLSEPTTGILHFTIVSLSSFDLC